MEHAKKLEMEKTAVRAVLRILKQAGFDVCGYNYGEGFTKATTEHAVMDAVFAVDECWVMFADADNKRTSLYFVLGNDPSEVVADGRYWPDSDFGKTMEEAYKHIERYSCYA